jgi:alkylated DNA repair dioxygenase AlkB
MEMDMMGAEDVRSQKVESYEIQKNIEDENEYLGKIGKLWTFGQDIVLRNHPLLKNDLDRYFDKKKEQEQEEEDIQTENLYQDRYQTWLKEQEQEEIERNMMKEEEIHSVQRELEQVTMEIAEEQNHLQNTMDKIDEKVEEPLIKYQSLSTDLCMDNDTFLELWNMIPDEYNYIQMYGKSIKTPRKYKVYGKAYTFPGMTDTVVDPVPNILQPYLDYINTLDNHGYNSVLINWYEGEDYIGYHRDDTTHLVDSSHIYGISFGQHRTLRFRRINRMVSTENINYVLQNNSMIVMKHGCQNKYEHSIIKTKKLTGKRINITIRAVK